MTVGKVNLYLLEYKKGSFQKMYNMKYEKRSFIFLGANINMKREFQISKKIKYRILLQKQQLQLQITVQYDPNYLTKKSHAPHFNTIIK